MKPSFTFVMSLVLCFQFGCTRSDSDSGFVSSLKRNSALEFLIVAEVGKFDEALLADVETPNYKEEAKLSNLVKDSNGVTIGRWVDLAREYAPEKEPNQRTFKYLPSANNFLRDGSTGILIDLGTFTPSLDFEQDLTNFKAWLDAKKFNSVQILCEEPSEDEHVKGQHFLNVRASTDERGQPCAAFAMTPKGARNIHRLTFLNLERNLGIVINNEVHTAPNISSAISQNGVITGNFTQEEIDELVINLYR